MKFSYDSEAFVPIGNRERSPDPPMHGYGFIGAIRSYAFGPLLYITRS